LFWGSTQDTRKIKRCESGNSNQTGYLPIYYKDYRRLSSKHDKIKVDVMKIIVWLNMKIDYDHSITIFSEKNKKV
jgi:hypothetical protein